MITVLVRHLRIVRGRAYRRFFVYTETPGRALSLNMFNQNLSAQRSGPRDDAIVMGFEGVFSEPSEQFGGLLCKLSPVKAIYLILNSRMSHWRSGQANVRWAKI